MRNEEREFLAYPEESKKESLEDLSNEFFDFAAEKSRRLANSKEAKELENPPANIIGTYDITGALREKGQKSSEEVIREIAPEIEKGNYDGACFYLSYFEKMDLRQALEKAKYLKERFNRNGIKFKAFHGTWPGMDIEKTPEIIEKDLDIAKIFDPEETAPINYDLSISSVPEIMKGVKDGKSVAEIRKNQAELTGFPEGMLAVEETIKWLGRGLERINNKRPFCIENPNTMLFYGARATGENIKKIINYAKEYFPKDTHWGLTIDLSHVLAGRPEAVGNFNKRAEQLDELTEFRKQIKYFAPYIKMVHLAGSTLPYSPYAKKLADRIGIQPETMAAMEVHQPIDQKWILRLLKEIREQAGKRKLVEVFEHRVFGETFAKYFGIKLPVNQKKIKEYFREGISLHGKMVGYTSRKN